MSAKLKELFRVIAAEAERNEKFRQDLEEVFSGVARPSPKTERKQPKNRRNAAVVNPYEAIKQGEQVLVDQLKGLDVEQLKDVISQFAFDSTKLALKWKDRERLIDLIVATTKGRLEKGDAFRNQAQ